MDIGRLLSVFQTLMAALNCDQLKEAWDKWGYKSHLSELSRVVTTAKEVLLDAETKSDELSPDTLLYIGELGNALYDVDDLLDKVVTLAKHKEIMSSDMFIEKVSSFFRCDYDFHIPFNMSQVVNKVLNKLDSITSTHNKFGLNLNHKPIRRKRDEACSYRDTETIGRTDDIQRIVGMLLDSRVQSDVSFLTIVGDGGLGKTTLAQLVFNHERITEEFSLRIWARVSYNEKSKSSMNTVLNRILKSAMGYERYYQSEKEMVNQMRKIIAGERFLIVLDDIWIESRDELGKLAGQLVGGEKGSMVVVTTRSKETTAEIDGNSVMYELKGLSDEDSWHLFQLMAFEQGLDKASSISYVDSINIAQEIVKICANVPLAIRVIGRLLYGQEKSKWLAIQELGLTDLRKHRNWINSILKLSYYNLEPLLKSCLSYCCSYPKDCKIEKAVIISLWMAQGYVVPLEKYQTIEDAGEEYFSVLLGRCFFQDVQEDEYGEITSFKLHDLMHDVVLEVAETEICPASAFNVDDKVVRYTKYRSTMTHICTFLVLDRTMCRGDIVELVTTFGCLRTLDLSRYVIKLPDSIGELIHLRYLNLAKNSSLQVLPDSITELYNLQTLILDGCYDLKKLPKDLWKLVNLRELGLRWCEELACMPWGIRRLTNLCKLSTFVVRESNSSSRCQLDELEGLKTLKKLRGTIEIVIDFPLSDDFFENHDGVIDGEYFRDKEHLKSIRFQIRHEDSDEKVIDYEEKLLGALQPHPNLKVLEFVFYRAVRMPRWADGDNVAVFLPNLVHLRLWGCSELQSLSSVGKLHFLKSLLLDNLPNFEYIESYSAKASMLEGLQFFPRLESLDLCSLPKLKEWWGPSGEMVRDNNRISSNKEPHLSSLFFPELKSLEISNCPELTSFPNCPKLTDLYLSEFNERLRLTTTLPSFKLKELTTDNVTSLSIESLQSLTSLTLRFNTEVESLTDFRQVFCACSFSLQTLSISGFSKSKIKTVFGVLGYLNALKSLTLYSLPMLNLADEETDGNNEGEGGGEGVALGSLCCTLQHLHISYCEGLVTFPKWMRKLTSLKQLEVKRCSPVLKERCQNPTGEDWPNIRHIPYVSVTD